MFSKKVIEFAKIVVKIFILRLLKLIVRFYLKKVTFRTFLKEVEGKSIWICGSAPSATPPDYDVDFTIAVSGACIALEKKFNKKHDMVIFDESTFDPSFQTLNKSKEHIIGKLAGSKIAGHVLLVNSNGSKSSKLLLNKFFGTEVTKLSTFLRAFIVNDVAGTLYLDNVTASKFTQVGTGAWVVSLAVFLGARHIYVTGINFRTGTKSKEYTVYNYGNVSGTSAIESYTKSPIRNHAAPDALVIAACALRFRSYCSIESNELELAPLINKNLS